MKPMRGSANHKSMYYRAAEEFILAYYAENYCAPTLRQLADACGSTSTSVMKITIGFLEQDGKVLLTPRGPIPVRFARAINRCAELYAAAETK